MSRPLSGLLREVRARDSDARFYFTGDYCDRGPDTRGVVDLLLELMDEGVATCVRGNHDDIFDTVINRHSYAGGPMLGGPASEADAHEAARIFWGEGLPQSLASYGGDVQFPHNLSAADFGHWLQELVDRVPADHRRFFRDLTPFEGDEDLFVVHASWPLDYPDDPSFLIREAHLRHEVIWGRYTPNQVRSAKVWQRHSYSGHTPTDNYLPALIENVGEVVQGNSLTLVDTGAFMSRGRLTAICHETKEFVQVHHSGELL